MRLAHVLEQLEALAEDAPADPELVDVVRGLEVELACIRELVTTHRLMGELTTAGGSAQSADLAGRAGIDVQEVKRLLDRLVDDGILRPDPEA